MADVKESALSTASDCAYVRALDSNGNSIRISKADLASVVGGLLASKKLYPFMLRGTLQTPTDFNNITESGIYSCVRNNDPSWGNYPPDSADGILRVYRGENRTDNIKYVIQEYTDYNSNSYIRILWGTSWRNWAKITSTIL